MPIRRFTPRASSEITTTVLMLASMPGTTRVTVRVGRGADAESIAEFGVDVHGATQECEVWTDRNDGLRLTVTTTTSVRPEQTLHAVRELLTDIVGVLITDARCSSPMA